MAGTSKSAPDFEYIIQATFDASKAQAEITAFEKAFEEAKKRLESKTITISVKVDASSIQGLASLDKVLARLKNVFQMQDMRQLIDVLDKLPNLQHLSDVGALANFRADFNKRKIDSLQTTINNFRAAAERILDVNKIVQSISEQLQGARPQLEKSFKDVIGTVIQEALNVSDNNKNGAVKLDFNLEDVQKLKTLANDAAEALRAENATLKENLAIQIQISNLIAQRIMDFRTLAELSGGVDKAQRIIAAALDNSQIHVLKGGKLAVIPKEIYSEEDVTAHLQDPKAFQGKEPIAVYGRDYTQADVYEGTPHPIGRKIWENVKKDLETQMSNFRSYDPIRAAAAEMVGRGSRVSNPIYVYNEAKDQYIRVATQQTGFNPHSISEAVAANEKLIEQAKQIAIDIYKANPDLDPLQYRIRVKQNPYRNTQYEQIGRSLLGREFQAYVNNNGEIEVNTLEAQVNALKRRAERAYEAFLALGKTEPESITQDLLDLSGARTGVKLSARITQQGIQYNFGSVERLRQAEEYAQKVTDHLMSVFNEQASKISESSSLDKLRSTATKLINNIKTTIIDGFISQSDNGETFFTNEAENRLNGLQARLQDVFNKVMAELDRQVQTSRLASQLDASKARALEVERELRSLFDPTKQGLDDPTFNKKMNALLNSAVNAALAGKGENEINRRMELFRSTLAIGPRGRSNNRDFDIYSPENQQRILEEKREAARRASIETGQRQIMQHTMRTRDEFGNIIPGARYTELYENGKLIEDAEIKFRGFTDYIVRHLALYGMLTIGIYGVANAFKSAAETGAEFEMELARIQMMNPAANLQQYATDIKNLTVKYGVNIGEAGGMAREIAGMGFTQPQVMTLTEQAMLMKNISPMEDKEAIDALTTAIIIYNQEVEKSSDIVDRWASIHRRSGISISEIAKGVTEAAESMKNLGADLGVTSALVATASRATLSDGQQAGNLLKMIATNIPQNAARVSARFGAKIFDQNGILLSGDQLFEELARTYVNLSAADRITMSKMLVGGGGRRADDFAKMMQAISNGLYDRIYAGGEYQAGVAASMNTSIMDTLIKRSEQLAAAFSALEATLTTGGIVQGFKLIGGFLTTVIQFLSAHPTLANLAAGGAMLAAGSGLWNMFTTSSFGFNLIKGMGERAQEVDLGEALAGFWTNLRTGLTRGVNLSALSLDMDKFTNSLTPLGFVLNSLKVGAVNAVQALSSLAAMLPELLLIGGITFAVSKLIQAAKDAKQSNIDAQAHAYEAAGISNPESEFSRLQALKQKLDSGTITDAEKLEYNKLRERLSYYTPRLSDTVQQYAKQNGAPVPPELGFATWLSDIFESRKKVLPVGLPGDAELNAFKKYVEMMGEANPKTKALVEANQALAITMEEASLHQYRFNMLLEQSDPLIRRNQLDIENLSRTYLLQQHSAEFVQASMAQYNQMQTNLSLQYTSLLSEVLSTQKALQDSEDKINSLKSNIGEENYNQLLNRYLSMNEQERQQVLSVSTTAGESGSGDKQLDQSQLAINTVAQQYEAHQKLVAEYDREVQKLDEIRTQMQQNTVQMLQLVMSGEKFAGVWDSIQQRSNIVFNTLKGLRDLSFGLQAQMSVIGLRQVEFGATTDLAMPRTQALMQQMQQLLSIQEAVEKVRASGVADQAALEDAIKQAMATNLDDKMKLNVVDPFQKAVQQFSDAVSRMPGAQPSGGSGGTSSSSGPSFSFSPAANGVSVSGIDNSILGYIDAGQRRLYEDLDKKQMIALSYYIAQQEGIARPDYFLGILNQESGFNRFAKNFTDTEYSVGIGQVNLLAHRDEVLSLARQAGLIDPEMEGYLTDEEIYQIVRQHPDIGIRAAARIYKNIEMQKGTGSLSDIVQGYNPGTDVTPYLASYASLFTEGIVKNLGLPFSIAPGIDAQTIVRGNAENQAKAVSLATNDIPAQIAETHRLLVQTLLQEIDALQKAAAQHASYSYQAVQSLQNLINIGVQPLDLAINELNKAIQSGQVRFDEVKDQLVSLMRLKELANFTSQNVLDVIRDNGMALTSTQRGSPSWYASVQNINDAVSSGLTIFKKVDMVQQAFDKVGEMANLTYSDLARLKDAKFNYELTILDNNIKSVSAALDEAAGISVRYFTAINDLVNYQSHLVDIVKNRISDMQKAFDLVGTPGILDNLIKYQAQYQDYRTALVRNREAQSFERIQSGGFATQNEFFSALAAFTEYEKERVDELTQKQQLLNDAFVGGAISLSDFTKGMLNLRDIFREVREQIVSFQTSVSSGTRNALSTGITDILSGNMVDAFMGVVTNLNKTLADQVGSAITTAIMDQPVIRNSLQDLFDSLTGSIFGGKPIDWEGLRTIQQGILGTLQGYLPVIQELLGGIFSTLQNSVFNAPSGFKLEPYIYQYQMPTPLREVANPITFPNGIIDPATGAVISPVGGKGNIFQLPSGSTITAGPQGINLFPGGATGAIGTPSGNYGFTINSPQMAAFNTAIDSATKAVEAFRKMLEDMPGRDNTTDITGQSKQPQASQRQVVDIVAEIFRLGMDKALNENVYAPGTQQFETVKSNADLIRTLLASKTGQSDQAITALAGSQVSLQSLIANVGTILGGSYMDTQTQLLQVLAMVKQTLENPNTDKNTMVAAQNLGSAVSNALDPSLKAIVDKLSSQDINKIVDQMKSGKFQITGDVQADTATIKQLMLTVNVSGMGGTTVAAAASATNTPTNTSGSTITNQPPSVTGASGSHTSPSASTSTAPTQQTVTPPTTAASRQQLSGALDAAKSAIASGNMDDAVKALLGVGESVSNVIQNISGYLNPGDTGARSGRGRLIDSGGKILTGGIFYGHPGERVLDPIESRKLSKMYDMVESAVSGMGTKTQSRFESTSSYNVTITFNGGVPEDLKGQIKQAVVDAINEAERRKNADYRARYGISRRFYQ